jgi:PKD repeat protein
MTRHIKLALLAVAVVALVTSAHAVGNYNTVNGDLIVGFSDETHNDVVYDLGPESAITNGETWKFGSTGLNIMGSSVLANTYWGVIGDTLSSNFVWLTTDGSFTPDTFSGHGEVNSINSATVQIYDNMSGTGVGNYCSISPSAPPVGNSWYLSTINLTPPTPYAAVYDDPNMFGAGSAPFYGVLGLNANPVQLGSFTLAANFVLTYNTNSTSSTPAAPVASFSGSPTNLFVSQSVVFTNTSANTFTNSIWSFGDGNMATNTTGANVTNKYNVAGTFTVSLAVSGTGGANLATSNNYVVVKPVPAIGNPMLLSGTGFVFSGTNGVAGAQYRIVSTNSLTVPLANWPTVFTGTFKPDGSYNYTNSPATNSARFFRLVSP